MADNGTNEELLGKRDTRERTCDDPSFMPQRRLGAIQKGEHEGQIKMEAERRRVIAEVEKLSAKIGVTK